MFSAKTKTITNTKQTNKRKTIRREQIHADIKVQKYFNRFFTIHF